MAVVEFEPGTLFLPVLLLAEIDYLLHLRLGSDAALDFLEAVGQGDFELVPLTDADFVLSHDLAIQCRDLGLGTWTRGLDHCRRRGTPEGLPAADLGPPPLSSPHPEISPISPCFRPMRCEIELEDRHAEKNNQGPRFFGDFASVPALPEEYLTGEQPTPNLRTFVADRVKILSCFN